MSGIEIPKGHSLQPKQADMEKGFKKVAKLYEQQFLREMVKAMKSTVNKSGLIKENMAERVYQGQLDSHYADQWGEVGGVGLSDVIFKQLQERFGKGVPIPSGPIDVNKKNEGVVLPKKDKSFQMGIPTSSNESLKAPWAGKVSQVIPNSDGSVSVRLEHEQARLSSIFKYFGQAPKLGTEVQQGEDLVGLRGVAQNVLWQVQKFTKPA